MCCLNKNLVLDVIKRYPSEQRDLQKHFCLISYPILLILCKEPFFLATNIFCFAERSSSRDISVDYHLKFLYRLRKDQDRFLKKERRIKKKDMFVKLMKFLSPWGESNWPVTFWSLVRRSNHWATWTEMTREVIYVYIYTTCNLLIASETL